MPEWQIMRTGEFEDMTGCPLSLTADVLAAAAASYNVRGENDRAPVGTGHKPMWENGDPAAGWVLSLRADGDALFADVELVDADVASRVDARQYSNVSAEMYPVYGNGNEPRKMTGLRLRRVAIIGDQPPAINGMKPISLSCGHPVVLASSHLITAAKGATSQTNGEAQMNEKQIEEAVGKAVESKMESPGFFAKLGAALGLKPATEKTSESVTSDDASRAELESLRAEKADRDALIFADKAVSERKLVPAFRDSIAALHRSSGEAAALAFASKIPLIPAGIVDGGPAPTANTDDTEEDPRFVKFAASEYGSMRLSQLSAQHGGDKAKARTELRTAYNNTAIAHGAA